MFRDQNIVATSTTEENQIEHLRPWAGNPQLTEDNGIKDDHHLYLDPHMIKVLYVPGGEDYQRADVTALPECIYTDYQAHQEVPKANSLPGGQTNILNAA